MLKSDPFPVERVRADFPIFAHQPGRPPLVYLDSAATSQKPQVVIDRLMRFYASEYATVRRGAYRLSQEATHSFEGVRVSAASFLGAEQASEIVFVRGVTEGINLIASALCREIIEPGDEIVISAMEHHSNIVPWQLACRNTGAVLRVIPFSDDGDLDLDALDEIIGERTKIVSVVHVSNGLGTVNPVRLIADRAHAVGAVMVVDGAQSAPHFPVDVRALDCDFFVCSGHKMLGPTGSGILYGRQRWLQKMGPYQGGGEMIHEVTFEKSTWEEPPYRFEAGTPAFAEVIGLGAAIAYLEALGMERVAARDAELVQYATERLREIPGLKIMGNPRERSGLVPFTIDGLHPLDIGMALDEQGIAIRTGQHCVQPVMKRYGVHATARASFGVYTTHQDIDALCDGLRTAIALFT